MSNKHILPASLIDYYSSNSQEGPVKIAIIGSDRFAINCLNELLEWTSGICLIGLFTEHSEKPDQTILDTCDLVLVDQNFSDIKDRLQRFNSTKTLVFDPDNPGHIRQHASPNIYRHNTLPQEPLTKGHPAVVTDPESSESFIKINALFSIKYGLSRRESLTLHYLVNGYSYKMIASEMFISIDTVRSHIKRIYQKLGINSIAQAIRKVLQENNTSIDSK